MSTPPKNVVEMQLKESILSTLDKLYELYPEAVREWIVNTFPDWKELYE